MPIHTKITPPGRRPPFSYEDRMRFIPGQPHSLDTEPGEAMRLKTEIIEELIRIKQRIASLSIAEDPRQHIDLEERSLKQFLWMNYNQLKHRDHILAVFLSIRRRRLLTRLKAASIALDMAAELLQPDNKVLDELRAAVNYQRELEKIIDARRKPNQASFRIKGQSKEEIREQIEAFEREAREKAQAAKESIDHRHIYGDAEETRRQLEKFDQQVRTIRGALVQGIGWFVHTWVKRFRTTREAMKYIARGEPIPPDVQEFEGIIYGPYQLHQWQEPAIRGQADYTIAMGRIPWEKAEKAQEPEFDESDNTPWPDM